MDVSPKTVREVEFREKLRGYHPEDVDQFLERVAKGIEILQERVRAATERAVRAERTAAESAGSDDTLRRTLVLAQRTADAAVQEAQEQAAEILGESQAKAARILADAEARVTTMIEQAESGVRSEVAELAAARDALVEDVGAMQRWLDEHRTALTATLTDAAERLQGDLHLLHPPPAVRSADIAAPAPVSRPEVAADAAPAADDPYPSAGPDHAGGDGGRQVPPPVEAAEGGSEAAAEVATGAGDHDVEDRWGPQSRRGDDREAAAAAQFFAELRDAVDDPQPLGPRQAEVSGPDTMSREYNFFEDEDDDDLAGARRFGSRLRRRR